MSTPRTGPDPGRWRALALLCGAFFMVLLDGTIGLALALLLLGRPRKALRERLQAVPAPIPNE